MAVSAECRLEWDLNHRFYWLFWPLNHRVSHGNSFTQTNSFCWRGPAGQTAHTQYICENVWKQNNICSVELNWVAAEVSGHCDMSWTVICNTRGILPTYSSWWVSNILAEAQQLSRSFHLCLSRWFHAEIFTEIPWDPQSCSTTTLSLKSAPSTTWLCPLLWQQAAPHVKPGGGLASALAAGLACEYIRGSLDSLSLDSTHMHIYTLRQVLVAVIIALVNTWSLSGPSECSSNVSDGATVLNVCKNDFKSSAEVSVRHSAFWVRQILWILSEGASLTFVSPYKRISSNSMDTLSMYIWVSIILRQTKCEFIL